VIETWLAGEIARGTPPTIIAEAVGEVMAAAIYVVAGTVPVAVASARPTSVVPATGERAVTCNGTQPLGACPSNRRILLAREGRVRFCLAA